MLKHLLRKLFFFLTGECGHSERHSVGYLQEKSVCSVCDQEAK